MQKYLFYGSGQNDESIIFWIRDSSNRFHLQPGRRKARRKVLLLL